eukprot:maker-scaffold_31-snap-gene-1.8-mRNA-1 protein AED:0.16 eAED:0.16 QI:0/0/0/1/1/1/2/0/421
MSSVVGETLLTTFKAMVTVFVIYFAGFMLVKLKKIDREGVSIFSQASNYLFVPSLLFVRLGSMLSLEVLKYAYILTVSGLALTIYYFVIAKLVLIPLANCTKRFERWFILGQSIVNYVALPLVLVSSICSQVKIEKPTFFMSEEEKNSVETIFFTESECIETGDLYIFMFSALVSLLTFSAGWQYVLHSPDEVESVSTSESTNAAAEVEKAEEGNKTSPQEIKEQPQTSESPEEKATGIEFAKKCWNMFLEIFIYRPLNFSQLAAILVGLIDPLRTLLFAPNGVLQSFSAGIAVIGTAATPLINVIIACTLSLKLLSLPNWRALLGGVETLGVSTRTVLLFAFGRMVIIPGITFAWFYFVVNAIFPEDKLMKLVALLELFVPTANMTVVLAQIIEQRDNAETLAASMLLHFLVIYLLDLEI